MNRLSVQQILLIVAIAVLGGPMLWNYLSLERAKSSLSESLERFGTAARRPGAVRDVERETDAARAGLKAARVLLAEEIDRRWLAELPQDQVDRAISDGEAKLELARDLALGALTDRPASWQALMILGGTRYLLASRRNAPSRWSERAEWERPLLEAIERSPLQPEPKRVLAAIYLSEWSVASDEERQATLPLLEQAFQNLETLEQLLPIWLRRAASFEQALSMIPEDPRAWRQLEHHYRQRQDWQRMVRVLERLERARPARLGAQLERAQRMVDGRDPSSARTVILSAIGETPIRLEYNDWLAQAIRLLPAGPVSARQADGFRSWLDWSFERCLIADCPFPGDVVRRLAGLARESEPARQAMTALLAGDLAGGLAIAGRSMSTPTAAWSPYLLLKARALAQERQTEAALRSLREIPGLSRYRLLAAQLARKMNLGNAGAEMLLEDLPQWHGRSKRQRRDFLPESPLERLDLRFDHVGDGGAALEVRVNGELEGFHVIEQGSILRLEFSPALQFATVELIHEGGALFRPSG